jgi:hypothetical protein
MVVFGRQGSMQRKRTLKIIRRRIRRTALFVSWELQVKYCTQEMLRSF